MDIRELDYALPERLIAQHPSDRRDASRLLVVDRATGSMRPAVFREIASFLRAGDCMALNETRVIRARLRARKDTGGQVEVFLLHEETPGVWSALVRPSARVKPGTVVTVGSDIRIAIGDVLPGGRRTVRFDVPDVIRMLEACGEVPLPPYIQRDGPDASDLTRYQTVYAHTPGSVAAPTAGLHFTPEVFASLDAAGVRRAFLTLHVGYGTFRPIQTERVEDHQLESEDFDLPEETAATLTETRRMGGRIIAVGTTATRVLETQHRGGLYVPGAGSTNCFIHPPHRVHAIDALQTNFHLPRSSLLALVCAFAGTDLVREAYQYAIREEFRFYSYGDAMLIL
ncbi:MAG TPA: tRNA preQ1(34) S-adenosylmethionine ribosyltransferase-isomerase QueA [Candidatus Hydrogenedentes bacterium]|nr:tRNA preQ1(34) S-adenosylmethionine ribosyltransferase-isomerase QueA [Candidatus Hydrogenedentota bacterium]